MDTLRTPPSCLLLTVAALLVPGCDDDSSPAVEADTIRIGFFRDDEGTGAEAVLASREINAAGGIELDGKRYMVEIVQEPHGESPAGAVEAVGELVERGAIAAVGPPWSSLVLGEEPDHRDGAAAAAIEQGLLLVSANATNTAISTLDDDDLIWRTIPSDDLQGPAGARFAYESRGGRRAAIFHRDDAYGRELSRTFADAFRELGGEVLATAAYSTQGDLDRAAYPELDEVFADMPDTVYVVSFEEFAQISNRIVQGGYLRDYGSEPPQFLAVDGSFFTSILNNGAPEVLQNLAGTVPGPDPDDPGLQRFRQRYEAEGLGAAADAWPYDYDAVYLIALAIQSAGSSDPDVFKQHMRRVSRDDGGDVAIGVDQWGEAREALLAGDGIDYDGASGPIDFTEAGDPGRGRYSLWTVEGSPDEGFTFDQSLGVEF